VQTQIPKIEKYMTPEEEINKERWYVLKKIEKERLRSKENKPIQYWVYFSVVGGDGPTAKNEVKTLEKLEELGAIKILNPGGTGEYE
jgi:hypothetical protein